MSDVATEVMAIIAKRIPGGTGDLKPTDKLSDLGLESIDAIDMIFDLEEKFGIEIPYNANSAQTEFGTVGDVVGSIERIVARKAASA